jgi:2,3-bisphosphoglycerate-dependent phosphoglycerate mutase
MSTRRIVAALVRHGDYHQPDRVPSAQLPHPLTAKGEDQARALGQALADEAQALGLTVDPVIDCSTLLRAWQTATLAAAALDSTGPRRALDSTGPRRALDSTGPRRALDSTGPRRALDCTADGRPDAPRFSVAEFLALSERSVGAGANLSVDAIAEALALDPRHPPLPPGWKAHPRFRLPVPGAESLLMAGARVAAHIEARVHELRQAPPGSGGLLKLFISHGGALRHAAVCMGALELETVAKVSMHHCGYVLVEHSPDPDGGPGRWHMIGGRWKQRSSATD